MAASPSNSARAPRMASRINSLIIDDQEFHRHGLAAR
jgi:hypothetical protein